MQHSLKSLTFFLFLLLITPNLAFAKSNKIIIGHGGAKGYAPMHTLASYKLALEMGVDYIEQDLNLTKDGVLVCIHDLSLERTTNVEEIYPHRFQIVEKKNPETEEVENVKSWRLIDFTLEEIKKLDAGSWFDKKYAGQKILTFQETIDLIKNTPNTKKTGIYPEIKNPAFYFSHGYDITQIFHNVLKKNGLDQKKGQHSIPVIVQSFYPENIKHLNQISNNAYKTIQLIWKTQEKDLLSKDGLKKISTYADGIAPLAIALVKKRSIVRDAQKQGLEVHPWLGIEKHIIRFKQQKRFYNFLFNKLKIDGLFTSYPDEVVSAINSW